MRRHTPQYYTVIAAAAAATTEEAPTTMLHEVEHAGRRMKTNTLNGCIAVGGPLENLFLTCFNTFLHQARCVHCANSHKVE